VFQVRFVLLTLRSLFSFVFPAKPLSDDLLRYVVPMCAPLSALVDYKYRLKLIPGQQKKGKTAKVRCCVAADCCLFPKLVATIVPAAHATICLSQSAIELFLAHPDVPEAEKVRGVFCTCALHARCSAATICLFTGNGQVGE
jgi:hypothetical protein